MGRFVTDVAAFAANVDNLPPEEKLPEISFWDAVLPDRLYGDRLPERKNKKKPVDPDVGMRVKREFYNVGVDGRGKKCLVAHKKREGVGAGAAEAEEKKAEEKKEEGGGDKGPKKENGNGNGKKAEIEKMDDVGDAGKKKAVDDPWTEEDDAILKSMKADGKTRNQMVDIVGRSKNALQNRYKEIKDDDADDGDKAKEEKKEGGEKGKGKGKGGKDGDGKKDKDNQNTKKEKQQKEKAADPAPPPKAPSKAPSAARSDGQARFTMQEWRTLQEDDWFSFSELQCLSELMMRDERHRWLRIASAFYETTGRRVHPDDIRDKFAQIEGMGSQK